MTLAWIAAAALQSAQPQPVADEVARAFVGPAQMVEVQPGRRLALRCMGTGPRTVLFDAGGSDWSAIWALVQPPLASQARVCSYDRAGLGRSDEAPGPRSPAAIVQDMRALVVAAKLSRPLVLVGHSLGGFNVKLYAGLFPEDVAGLVLVDPAEDRWWDRTRDATIAQFGAPLAVRSELSDATWFQRLADRYRDCAARAEAEPLDPKTDDYKRCADPVRPALGPLIAAERLTLQPAARYQRAQASEILNSVYASDKADPAYRALFRPGILGERPLIVLTHGQYDPGDPLDRLGQAQGIALHKESSALSRRGSHRVVEGSGHNIQVEKPQAIIDAVRDVLRELDR